MFLRRPATPICCRCEENHEDDICHARLCGSVAAQFAAGLPLHPLCTEAMTDDIPSTPADVDLRAVEQLTLREKECLRLLLTPLRAKGIARTTGLSVNTVNEHLKSARRKLGTGDSLTAAQLLRAAEELTNNSDTNKSGSPSTASRRQKHLTETSASALMVTGGSRLLPFATKGRPWNGQSFGWRLAWPFLLFGIVAIGAGSIMAVASGLSQLTIALTR